MARYGTFPYTTGILYGPSGVSLFRVGNFVAKSRSYGTISLSWDNPTGQWNHIRLVRSSYGFPAHQSDGSVLFDSNSGSHAYGTKDQSINSWEDDGHADGLRLTPGKTYYYTLWIQYSQGSQIRWARGGDAQAIAVSDHGYLDFLLRRLPSIYTTREMQSDGQPSQQSSGMNRFMSLMAFDLSRYRDTLEGLRSVNDPDATDGLLLPSMGNQLAYRYEPEIGMRQNRVLMRNATYLAQRKGTELGVAGLVSSVTGYGVVVNPLRNLMHDDNDANAASTTGRWVATGGTLSRDTTVAVPADNSYTSTAGTFAFTASATSGSVSLYDDLPKTTGIPVTAGNSYVFSVYLQSATTSETPNLTVNWYDAAGASLSASTAAAPATSTSAWERASSAVTAPANACFATLAIAYPTLAVSEVQYLKAVQFEPGTTVSEYRPAREVLIDLEATRVNEITNPSFDVDLTGWATDSANTTLTRSTTVAREGGLASAGLTVAAAGNAYAVINGVCDPDKPFAASFYALLDTGSPLNVHVQVDWYDSGSTYLSSSAGTDVAANATDWKRASLLGRSPANAASFNMILRVPAMTTSQTVYFDDVLFEHNSLLEDYFDKRYEVEAAYLENGAAGYPARTHLYPLYPYRYARAKRLVDDSVLLGTTVTYRKALPR